MIFEDIKTTEPFVHLATAAGADAHSSILQAPQQWWFCLINGLSKKKNGGQRSWILVIATCLYIIAVFGISPLSASILLPTEVFVPSNIQFNRMLPTMDTELDLTAGRETYFRTLGNLLQNVPTSAWLPDSYVVMPFWPSGSDLNLGPLMNGTVQKWRAETTVFRNEFECTPLTETKRSSHVTVQVDGPNTFKWAWFTLNMESLDGCKYELEINSQLFGMIQYGGAQWTTLDALFEKRTDNYGTPRVNKITANDDGIASETSGTSVFDYFKVSISEGCSNRELILATSPVWDTPISYAESNSTVPPTIYSNHTMQAHLCASTPYMASIPVTMSLSSSRSLAVVDDEDFLKRRQPVPESFLNHSSLSDLYFDANWTAYMSQSKILAAGDLGGPASVLGAWYKFNATVMSTASGMPEQAARIRQRFFGELLMSSFNNQNKKTTEQQNITGELTIPQRRVVVVAEAAIALALLFCISFVIMVSLFFLSRPTRRSLQLLESPFSTVGAAALITSGSAPKSSGHLAVGMTADSETDFISKRYSLRNGNLLEHDTPPSNRKESSKILAELKKSDRRPWLTRLRVMLSLLSYLLLLVVALAILYHFATKSLLYQTAFVYQTSLPAFNKRFSTIAPYSIVPTLLAVCVGLWWDALDKSFRSMQPYLTMSQRPTRLADGVCVSYHSSYWAWAAVKAARHKHWVLFAITLGSTLCHVFIVSMSALFERKSVPMTEIVPIERTLELQQVPNSQSLPSGYSAGTTGGTAVLEKLFENVDTSWMYTAIIQLVLNGTEPAWSREGWSFIPVDTSHIEKPAIQKTGRNDDENDEDGNQLDDFNDDALQFLSMTVTLHTPALRARLECNPVDTGNFSEWFELQNLTDTFEWNVTTNPQDWKTGWWTNKLGGGNLSTSFFAHPTRLNCCGNTTGEDEMVAVGYWSTANSWDQPHSFEPWPVNLTSKWLHGRGRDIYHRNTNMPGSEAYTSQEIHAPYLVFPEPPKLQVLTCAPTIESADAEVTVDKDTGEVLSYNITNEEPRWETQAWSDPFVIHNSTAICRQQFPNTNWTDPVERANSSCSLTNVTTR
jgi:hypothetical protein